MAKTLKPGDRVRWYSSGGQSVGKVIEKLTKPTKINHPVKASPDNPQYLVESESVHKRAAHKPGALKKR